MLKLTSALLNRGFGADWKHLQHLESLTVSVLQIKVLSRAGGSIGLTDGIKIL